MTGKSIPLILKIEDWPKADQEAWPTLFERSKLFDDAGQFEHWAFATKRAAQERYGQWLSYLFRERARDLVLPPVCRISKDAVRGFILEAEGRVEPITVMGLVTNLKVIAIALDGDADWAWLKRAAQHWAQVGSATGLKPPIPITASAVLSWSLKRCQEVSKEAGEGPSVVQALQYRDALMVGCLIACPVRSRAFAAMTVDRHVQVTDEGLEFHFLKSDMKDKSDHSFVVTPRLAAPMRRYLVQYRPMLLRGRTNPNLWIGRGGRALSQDGLACHLKNVTASYLGVGLRPHAFRHIAATSIAEVDPEHVGIMRDILGHATLDMAQKHYNRATGVASCNALQSVVVIVRRRAAL